MNNYKTNLKLDNEVETAVLNFATKHYSNRNLFEYNGNGRQFCILNQTRTPVSDLAIDARKKIFKQFGVSSFDEEPMFGVFLGVNNETGFVYQHTDSTKDGFYHVRLNFLLSKPNEGGMPVINGQEFIVDEGESWVNLASEWQHRSTPVVGNKLRVVLSLGALVEKKQIDPILKEMGIE